MKFVCSFTFFIQLVWKAFICITLVVGSLSVFFCVHSWFQSIKPSVCSVFWPIDVFRRIARQTFCKYYTLYYIKKKDNEDIKLINIAWIIIQIIIY